MKNTTTGTEAGRLYATAYEAHYTSKNMQKAFNLYGRVIADYSNAPEAEYSRSQMQNIVNAVVPKQESADALAKLALAHFEQSVTPDANHV